MKLNLNFNGAQLVGSNLQQALEAAGENTAISVNTAQAIPISELSGLMQLAARKNFACEFNGAQLAGYGLQRAISEAGPSTSFGVEAAHAAPIDQLVSAVQIAGSRKFVASFNGEQLQGGNIYAFIRAGGG